MATTTTSSEATPAALATDPFDLFPAVNDDDQFATGTPAVPADHAVTIQTATELLGKLKPATVRRYLAAGKLTSLDGGISAASITTYAAARTVNVTRTRFRPTGRRTGRPTRVSPATVTTVPAAHAALTEARKLEAIVKELRAAAKTTLEAAGAGTVVDGVVVVLKPGRQIQDNKKIKAHYAALKQTVPMTTSAPSWDAIPVR